MFEYLIILFLSPLIFLFLFTVPQYIWSLFQKPKLDAKVNQLYERNPEVTISEKVIAGKMETEILIKNFRNTKYKSSEWDNEVSWENKKFNFADLDNLEILVDHYASLQSHVILVANFLDQHRVCKRLCISYEPKKKNPENFQVQNAFYRNFEAGYIIGSYEDLVGVRFQRYANFISNPSPLVSDFKNLKHYKLNFTKNECQEIYKSLIKDINLYSKQAFFYNFVYRNCLSEILKHFKVSKRFNFTSYQLLNLDAVLVRNNVIIK